MNTKESIRLGIPPGEATRRARDFISQFIFSGGDETNIHEMMAAQKDLVTILGRFEPKLVNMAPHGKRAED